MALRDQPYLPLYVQDYLTDEKLNMCSWATQGIYIKVMCILHKSEEYGTILLKQKDKRTKNNAYDFATKIAKILPVDRDKLYEAIKELIDEGCLTMDEDKLYQKRMVADNKLSIIRAESGKKGGIKTQKFAKAKYKANTENENENEDINIKGGVGEKEVDTTSEFEDFWNKYHEITGIAKSDKEPARKHFRKLTKAERILAAENIKPYFESIDPKYCKKARTYLSDKNFNDEFKKRTTELKIETDASSIYKPFSAR